MSNNQNQPQHSSLGSITTNFASQTVEFLAKSFHSNPSTNASLSIKLDQNNYLIWKEKIKILIIVYSLEGFIDGFMNAPPRFLDMGKIASNHRLTN